MPSVDTRNNNRETNAFLYINNHDYNIREITSKVDHKLTTRGVDSSKNTKEFLYNISHIHDIANLDHKILNQKVYSSNEIYNNKDANSFFYNIRENNGRIPLEPKILNKNVGSSNTLSNSAKTKFVYNNRNKISNVNADSSRIYESNENTNIYLRKFRNTNGKNVEEFLSNNGIDDVKVNTPMCLYKNCQSRQKRKAFRTYKNLKKLAEITWKNKDDALQVSDLEYFSLKRSNSDDNVITDRKEYAMTSLKKEVASIEQNVDQPVPFKGEFPQDVIGAKTKSVSANKELLQVGDKKTYGYPKVKRNKSSRQSISDKIRELKALNQTMSKESKAENVASDNFSTTAFFQSVANAVSIKFFIFFVCTSNIICYQ